MEQQLGPLPLGPLLPALQPLVPQPSGPLPAQPLPKATGVWPSRVLDADLAQFNQRWAARLHAPAFREGRFVVA
ncbi:MAG: hypothetical protein ACKPKO_45530, partial [Candidatus Fonsibacter sp.]